MDTNGVTGMKCAHDPDQMDRLIDAVQSNGDRLDAIREALNVQYNTIIRWLLGVVCIIALGKSAIETIQTIWGKPTSAQATSR